jgi:alkaline phosphatase D
MKRTTTAVLALACLALLTNAPLADPAADKVLAAGPMPAWAEMTSACVWVQSTRPCDIQLRYWTKGDPESPRLSPVIATSADADHIAMFVLKDLQPGTRYAYEAYLNGRRAKFDWPLEFQTQALWRWRGEPPEFTFTLGSCLYINDEPFDRPGRPYGGDFELLEALAADQADFMLWLGDNVYLREPDWLTEEGIRYRYRHTRAFGPLQRVLATRHNYAVWDDHDYGPNDSDRGYRLKEQALKVFRDYWPGVQYGTATAPGGFSRFEWADVEFFLLDDRWYRTPNKAELTPNKTMFGEAQLQWLKDGLVASQATFKIVAAGGQLMNPLAPYEGLARIPHEQKALQQMIVANRIPGVLFLSGDRHHSELIRVTPAGGYPLYDFTCSPLSAGARTLREGDPEETNAARIDGTLVTGQRSYGRVRVVGNRDERTLILSCHDKQGQPLWEHRVNRSDLSFR